jgi:WD40 repeat protein
MGRPDGSRAEARRCAQVWRVSTGRWVATLSGHEGRIHSVSFNADGSTIASGVPTTPCLMFRSQRVWSDMPRSDSSIYPTVVRPGTRSHLLLASAVVDHHMCPMNSWRLVRFMLHFDFRGWGLRRRSRSCGSSMDCSRPKQVRDQPRPPQSAPHSSPAPAPNPNPNPHHPSNGCSSLAPSLSGWSMSLR